MKKFGLIVVLHFVGYIGGCTADTNQAVQSATYTPTEELAGYYVTWQQIADDPTKLTPVQRELLAEFNRHPWTEENLDDFELKFVNIFPWIDIQELTVRDKVFLVQTAREMQQPIKWALLG